MCLDTGRFVGPGLRTLDVVDRFHGRINHVDSEGTVAFRTYKTLDYGELR